MSLCLSLYFLNFKHALIFSFSFCNSLVNQKNIYILKINKKTS